jgi:preprotein translocase subunit YajC
MSHHLFSILAQASAASSSGASQPGSIFNTLVPLACIGVIMYFLMIRPQSQRQKDQEALIKSIKTGDKVVTSSGIHGMIANVKETTVILKIADNVKIEMDKSSIGVVKRDQAEAIAAS